MSDKPISLSKFRKGKARDSARKQADANAIKFGRSKADRLAHSQKTASTIRHMDAHRRENRNDPKDDETSKC